MSNTIDQAFIDQFETEVKQAYQGSGMLRGTVRETSVTGDTVRFPRIGSGNGRVRSNTQRSVIADSFREASTDSDAAVTSLLSSNSLLLNLAHSNATATMVDYVFPELVDKFDQVKVNYDIRAAYAEAIGMAMGRTVDQVIIDAMNASGVTQTIAHGSADLTVAKLREANRIMGANGVDMGDRYFAYDALSQEALLGETEITSSDYNSVKALVAGDVDSFLSFKFKLINDRSTATGSGEGGLPLASNVTTNFAYHKKAVGVGFAMDPSVEINYLPEYLSTLINGKLSLGAVAIEADGVIKVNAQHS